MPTKPTDPKDDAVPLSAEARKRHLEALRAHLRGVLDEVAMIFPASMTGADAIPAGTAGKFYFGFNQIEAHRMRLSFIADGGGSSGTLLVGVHGEGL